MSFHLPPKSLKNQMIGPSPFHEPSIARAVKIVDESNADGLNRFWLLGLEAELLDWTSRLIL
ncbi:hypothetical protein HanRHA438_Chr06g0269971 [Helianthus annuus]|uniref:Uncharacterized protein n=1 Tax=Helianthus annuus TaxID=4232 RepID=A0A251U2B2_HELAN|nr:hypothetical protein HanXRQr2_Chr06g0260931 [Helianthus annuus]KAJ0560667.1 hypothetical protein HanHA300_Chr06g0213921 [Helianthus annuus]KAJ0573703.1 hypothetical protein HanHA89_Chr06g0229691 [Helianthus annuus]KAJ0740931.1 hypothetical protein HanOQP8_Chr06g0222231 [Helianthus annuus]KAJ0912053.1 hypothetical protein HanRHA438_Chr06g0269971 [Helianthus annuus]